MALQALIDLDFNVQYTRTNDLSTPTEELDYVKRIQFSNGAGANQAQYLVADKRTLAASASEDLDMAAVLTDAYGAAITFASVKAMLFSCPASAAGDLTITAKGTDGFSSWAGAAGDAIKVKPGGFILLVAPGATGYAVTGGTGDLLTVTNGDGAAAVEYDVILMGD